MGTYETKEWVNSKVKSTNVIKCSECNSHSETIFKSNISHSWNNFRGKKTTPLKCQRSSVPTPRRIWNQLPTWGVTNGSRRPSSLPQCKDKNIKLTLILSAIECWSQKTWRNACRTHGCWDHLQLVLIYLYVCPPQRVCLTLCWVDKNIRKTGICLLNPWPMMTLRVQVLVKVTMLFSVCLQLKCG